MTAGVGQTEIAVTHVADSVVLVVQPGSGDVLQFLKAGVMEIPDLLVVNKADHGPTAERAASDLKSALSTLRQVDAGEGDQQVIQTSARDQQGAAGVVERRRMGHAAWSLDWLVRRVGTLGLDALGGLEAVSEQLQGREPALAAAQALADRLELRLR